ncbi:hypothetical protein YC2023_084371 [Brassica napus]
MGRCPRADTHDARHKTTQSRNHIKTHNWYIAKQKLKKNNSSRCPCTSREVLHEVVKYYMESFKK